MKCFRLLTLPSGAGDILLSEWSVFKIYMGDRCCQEGRHIRPTLLLDSRKSPSVLDASAVFKGESMTLKGI